MASNTSYSSSKEAQYGSSSSKSTISRQTMPPKSSFRTSSKTSEKTNSSDTHSLPSFSSTATASESSTKRHAIQHESVNRYVEEERDYKSYAVKEYDPCQEAAKSEHEEKIRKVVEEKY